MVARALPATPATALPLIVDGEGMTFTLDYLPGCAEYLAHIELPTEDQASRARIALAFSGAHGYWNSYDDDRACFFAVGFYPLASLPACAV